MMESILGVVNFNCRGFWSSEDYLKLLAKQADVLAIQEHCLRKEQFNMLNRLSADFYYSAVSPMESCQMYGGHPFGGVAILWRKGLQKYVRVLKTGSANVCAIGLQFEPELLLLVSVYMPCNYGNSDSVEAYEEQLGCIQSLLQDSQFSKNIIIGDFNGDPRLCSESHFSWKILNFANVNNLSIVDYDLLI